MSIEDVKKILDVKSDRIAVIYAQQVIKEVLKKFYKAVEGMEEREECTSPPRNHLISA